MAITKTQIGEILKAKRERKNISVYGMTKKESSTGATIRHEAITAIEEGVKSYTVDKLLLYMELLEVKFTSFKNR